MEENLSKPIPVVGMIVALLAAATGAYALVGIKGFLIVILPPLIITAAIYSIFVFFAPRDLFFTSVKEGQAKAIMKGTRDNPQFIRMIMSYKGYTFDNKNWNIIPVEEKHPEEKHPLGGVRWLGIPGIYWVHNYKFKWTSMIEDGTLETKEKSIDYIYVKTDVYAEILRKAEVGESMVPVNINFLITARVVNPYTALFRVERWLEYVTNRIKAPARDYVAQQKDPMELVNKREDLGPLLYKKLEDAQTIKDFKNEAGVEVLKLETPEIDLGAFQEKATVQWQARQDGEAEVIKKTKAGEAYKAEIAQKKEADMDYIDGVFAKVCEFGHTGLVLRYLDKLVETATKQGNVILSVGSIGDIARQIFAGQESSSDIAALIENLTKGKKTVSKETIERLKKLLNEMETKA